MKTEIQEILDLIEKDEYYNKLNKFIKRTLFDIAEIVDSYGNCTYKTLEMICVQSRVSQTQYLSDVIKLLFLGYISRNDIGMDSEHFVLGSKKIDTILENTNLKKQSKTTKLEATNHLKLWLNSKINSVKDQNSLMKYRGQTIENIYKQDPKYLIEKIYDGHFILSLSSVEILEKKYQHQFPTIIKEWLQILNEEYLEQTACIKKKLDCIKDDDNLSIDTKTKRSEFLSFLNKRNYPYKIVNGEIMILSIFHWENDISLLDNLTITSNLKIYNFLESPKIIPRGLKVGGYIQFGCFKFTGENSEEHSFDVWMKLE